MGSEPKASAAELARELVSTRAELQQMAAELENHRLLNATLEEALRARDAVLSVVAHDLRNPLNIINLAANTLLQRLPDSNARRPVERIVRSARRADRMISDL